MEKIFLSKSIMVENKETNEIELDFSKITGKDLVKAEAEARAKGDASPSMSLSMKYQLILAAKITGVKYEDLTELPAVDCKKVIAPVALFYSVRHKKQQAHSRACLKFGDEYINADKFLYGAYDG